jgi:hypothetical protein
VQKITPRRPRKDFTFSLRAPPPLLPQRSLRSKGEDFAATHRSPTAKIEPLRQGSDASNFPSIHLVSNFVRQIGFTLQLHRPFRPHSVPLREILNRRNAIKVARLLSISINVKKYLTVNPTF